MLRTTRLFDVILCHIVLRQFYGMLNFRWLWQTVASSFTSLINSLTVIYSFILNFSFVTVHHLPMGKWIMFGSNRWIWNVLAGKRLCFKAWHSWRTLCTRIWHLLRLWVYISGMVECQKLHLENSVFLLRNCHLIQFSISVMASCGEIVRENGTYFVNPNHPNQVNENCMQIWMHKLINAFSTPFPLRISWIGIDF